VYSSTHRSVYVMTQRLQRHPFLGLFDAPDTNTSTDQRTSSTVPPQALFLMNNPFVAEQAEAFARRVTAEAPDPDQWVDRAARLAWSRPATPPERERASSYLDACRARLAEAGVPVERRELEARVSYARVLFCSNEFVYLD
jgi:hypothetical protein